MAQEEKDKLKAQKLKHLFSKSKQSEIELNFICVALDRANHKIADTLMLTQRIGAFNYVQFILDDGEPRSFYDKFEVLPNGKEYKG